ncbi:MAG: chromophore lyase CpcT/CpeT [Thermoanaerobaculia bacterium]
MRSPARLSIVLSAILLSSPLLAAEPGVTELSAWLAGTFDNREQASRDPEGFGQTRLVSVVVPKSRIGLGAPVLYVEEAPVAVTNRPFVRRFWRIEETGAGKFVARLFDPKDPIAVSGKWRDPSDLALFGLSDVLERPGCAVSLRKIEDHYDGVSEGIGCPWPLGGSRYLTTRMDVYAGRLALWERGFDGTGRQVWGTVKGPVQFVKRSDAPPSEPSSTPALAATPAAQPAPASETPAAAPSPIVSGVAPIASPPAAPAPLAMPSPVATIKPLPAPVPAGSAALSPPAAVMAPSFPSALLTPSLLVRGLGADRQLELAEIRALPMTTLRQPAEGKKGAAVRGVALIELLRRCGLRTDGMEVRRLLAPAVILAVGADGYTAAFSIEELLTPGGGAILVLPSETKPSAEIEAAGAFAIVEPAKIRSVRDVRSLELRILATNRPETR